MSAAEQITEYGFFSHKRCDACGMGFFIPSNIERRCADEGRAWWCPGCGHRWVYGELASEKERKRLERERDNLAKRLEWAENDARHERERAEVEERRGKAYKGHATRLRKRIAEGKCPCCSQTFADLAKHIAAKHPRYVPTEET